MARWGGFLLLASLVLVDDLLESVVPFSVVKLSKDVILLVDGCYSVRRLAVLAKVKVGASSALVTDPVDAAPAMIAYCEVVLNNLALEMADSLLQGRNHCFTGRFRSR